MGKGDVVQKIPKGSGRLVSMIETDKRILFGYEYKILELSGGELKILAESEAEAKDVSPAPQSFK